MASGSPWGAFCGSESQLIESVSSCSSVQSRMALHGVGLRFEAWQSSNPGSCTCSAIQSTSHLFCSPRTMGTRGKRDDGDLLADKCNRSQQCHMSTRGTMMVMNRSKKRRNSIDDPRYVARLSNHLLLSLSSSRTCLPYLRQFTYPSSCQPRQGRVYTNEWPPVPANPWRLKKWHGMERVGGVGKAFLEVGSREEIWYWGRMTLSLYSLGGISVSAAGKTILAGRISPLETCWSYRLLSENQGRQVRARLGRHRSLCPRCSSSISTGPNQGASLATPEAEQQSTGDQARHAGRGIGGVWDRDEGDWASYRTQSLMPSKLAAPTALPPFPPAPTDASIFSVMPYLWKLASSHSNLRWRLFMAIALLFLGKIAGLAGPLLFKKAVDALTIAQTSTAAPPIALAISYLILSCVVKAVSSVFNELRYVLFAPVSHATGRQVALHFFEHVLGMDMAFHLERKTGSLAKILDRGKRSVSMIFRAVVFTFVPTVVELVLVCGLLARNVSPLFASIVFVTFLAYVLWTILLTQAAAASRKEVNVLDNFTTGKAVDALLNYETVMQFNNQSLESAQYNGLLHGYQQASIQAEYIMSLMNAGQATILAMGTGLIMALAGIRVFHGTMTVGDLVLANGLVLQLSLPLQFLGFWYRDVRQSLVDMENMFDLLGTKSKLKDGTDILPYEERGADVHVRDVRFGYNESREVLRGVSFSVSSGQSIAIVGTSGSGKSTIVKLLLRLFDPTAGVVTIDGYDVRSLKQESLRSVAALVPQDTVLFNDTIFHNIAYGRPDATDNEIIDAAKKAHLHQAIMRMPDQYNTVVGERGIKLSGGEKQRVAIARAFLKSPRLLICDEATSALDSTTESAILKSLKELASGRTCVFVAHRLSTIKHCDHILVMEMGQVLEEGSHSELIARNGRYTHMWAMQEMERPLRLYAKEDAKDDGSYNVDSSTNGPLRQSSDDEDDDILSSVDVQVDTNLLDVDDLISRDDARGDLENYHRGEGGGSGSSNLKLINE